LKAMFEKRISFEEQIGTAASIGRGADKKCHARLERYLHPSPVT